MSDSVVAVVAVGNPFDGMRFFGPFEGEDAMNYAEENHQGEDYWIVKLETPEHEEV